MDNGKMITLADLICGNCKNYDSDTCLCAIHPEYGELVEEDTCDDWEEDL